LDEQMGNLRKQTQGGCCYGMNKQRAIPTWTQTRYPIGYRQPHS
jgi:hypothetical protein